MSVELDIGPLSWVKGEIDLALERAGECLKAYAADPAGDGLGQGACQHASGAWRAGDCRPRRHHRIRRCHRTVARRTWRRFGQGCHGRKCRRANGFHALRGYLDDLMAGHPDQPLKLLDGLFGHGRGARIGGTRSGRPVLPRSDATSAETREGAALPCCRRRNGGSDQGGTPGFRARSLEMAEGRTQGRRRNEGLDRDDRDDARHARGTCLLVGIDRRAGCHGGRRPAGCRRSQALCHAPRCPGQKAQRRADRSSGAGTARSAVPRRLRNRREAMPWRWFAPPIAWKAWCRPPRRPKPSDCCRSSAACATCWPVPRTTGTGSAPAPPPRCRPSTNVPAKIAEEGTATGQADYQRLTAAILDSADRLRRDPSRHNEAMALEMATALLLAESALENFQSLDAEFAHSTDAVIERLAAVERGEELGMLELPHLDAMSRRAQERLLLESVAREIKSNLGTIETALDAFFRDSSKQSGLAALQKPIRQIQGALLVLGQDRANAVLAECAQRDRALCPGRIRAPGGRVRGCRQEALGAWILCHPVAGRCRRHRRHPGTAAASPGPGTRGSRTRRPGGRGSAHSGARCGSPCSCHRGSRRQLVVADEPASSAGTGSTTKHRRRSRAAEPVRADEVCPTSKSKVSKPRPNRSLPSRPTGRRCGRRRPRPKPSGSSKPARKTSMPNCWAYSSRKPTKFSAPSMRTCRCCTLHRPTTKCWSPSAAASIP
jgi:hypothetical protein